jgi:2'-5' RNA ligase
MKATFALLANLEVYNLVRKIAWNAHRDFEIGLDIARLEPHVSLKQPFEVRDFAALENTMQNFGASIPPFDIGLTEVQVIPAAINGLETAILWIDVEQSSELRALHQQLNRTLEGQFGLTPADHDGDEYHFHMTIAIGNKPFAVYQEVLRAFSSPRVDLRFRPRELAMFVYADNFNLNQGYTTYKRIPVGEKNHV